MANYSKKSKTIISKTEKQKKIGIISISNGHPASLRRMRSRVSCFTVNSCYSLSASKVGLGSGPRLLGRIGSGSLVSAIFRILHNPRNGKEQVALQPKMARPGVRTENSVHKPSIRFSVHGGRKITPSGLSSTEMMTTETMNWSRAVVSLPRNMMKKPNSLMTCRYDTAPTDTENALRQPSQNALP